MPVVTIGDCDVPFPFKPYEAQVAYMAAVIGALDRGENALLESPTGTGKTLCLLCATIAWTTRRCKMVARYPRGAIASGSGNANADVHYRILYCSRTHAQLTQVIRELKRALHTKRTRHSDQGDTATSSSDDAPREVSMALLGSREHLCVNAEVLRLPSSHARQSVCNSLRADKNCRFFHGFQANGAAGCVPVSDHGDTIYDLEDVVREGKRNGFCPYYVERDLAETADIVLMPYNYILDPQLRKQLPFELTRNCILIVDEAHNLPSVLSAAGCLTLQPLELANAIQDCTRAIAMQMIAAEKADGDARAEAMRGEEFASLKILLARLETCVATEEIGPAPVQGSFHSAVSKSDTAASKSTIAGELVRPGEYIEVFLAKALITREVFEGSRGTIGMSESITNAIALLMTSERPAMGLPHVQQFLSAVFATPIDESTRFVLRSIHSPISAAGGGATGAAAPRSLGFWRLDNTAELTELSRLLWCMLLTSGTLSPLDHFAAELGAPFPVRLRGSHVIGPDQVLGSVLCRGPTGDRLNGGYAFRASTEHRNALGMALLNVSRVTPGGTLVFFPSYTALHSATDHWRAGTGQAAGTKTVWGLLTEQKPVFVEPTGSADLAQVVAEFQRAVRENPRRGAILLAVCRGKVSEGVDFADNDGRCVLVTGIPFANHTDLFVRLKREYLTSVAPQRPRVSGALFTGDSWYRHEAMRAVSQAVGRVVRHKDDYGAIVLADERFADHTDSLPDWVAVRTTVHRDFRDVYPALVRFFAQRFTDSRGGCRRGDTRAHGAGDEGDEALAPCELNGPAGHSGLTAVPHSAVLARAYAERRKREASAEALRRHHQRLEEASERPREHVGRDGDDDGSADTSGSGIAGGAAPVQSSARPTAVAGTGTAPISASPFDLKAADVPRIRKETLAELTARHAAVIATTSPSAGASSSVMAAMGSTSKEFCAFLKERVRVATYNRFKEALTDVAQLRGALRNGYGDPASAVRQKFGEVVCRLHMIFLEAAEEHVMDVLTEFGRHIPEELRPLYAHAARQLRRRQR